MAGLSFGSKQHAWFMRAAEASRAPFQVVVAHHPPYSSGQHGDTTGADWDYEKHGVDLVLSGHDHDYERIERDGITYVVNGAGGGNLRRMGKQGAAEGSAVFHHETHGAQRVEVRSAEGGPETWKLTATFIDVNGKEIDSFTLTSTTE